MTALVDICVVLDLKLRKTKINLGWTSHWPLLISLL